MTMPSTRIRIGGGQDGVEPADAAGGAEDFDDLAD